MEGQKMDIKELFIETIIAGGFWKSIETTCELAKNKLVEIIKKDNKDNLTEESTEKLEEVLSKEIYIKIVKIIKEAPDYVKKDESSFRKYLERTIFNKEQQSTGVKNYNDNKNYQCNHRKAKDNKCQIGQNGTKIHGMSNNSKNIFIN